jgi:transcription-repair coupling factor (superfamily II helicase)
MHGADYHGGDRIYVPLKRLDLIRSIRRRRREPQLDKLGGTSWVQRKSRGQARDSDMAQDLLQLYAHGRSLWLCVSADSRWQKNSRRAFPYGRRRTS